MHKIDIAHTFEGTPADYLAVIDDPGFPAKLCVCLNLKERTLLVKEDRGDHVFVQWKVAPNAELPAPVKAALGGRGIFFIEEEKQPKERPYHREWNVVLEALGPKRFRCAGTFDVVPEGNGTRRVLRGEIDVNLFGVGGIVEKHVVKGMQESYDKSSELVREGLRERLRAR